MTARSSSYSTSCQYCRFAGFGSTESGIPFVKVFAVVIGRAFAGIIVVVGRVIAVVAGMVAGRVVVTYIIGFFVVFGFVVICKNRACVIILKFPVFIIFKATISITATLIVVVGHKN